jgi:hypothetical protein
MTYRFFAVPLAASALIASVACNPPADPGTDVVVDAGVADGADTTSPDSMTPIGAGTCNDPIRLETAAMRSGTDWIFEGSTAAGHNDLHPYGAGDVQDAEEAVLEFRVPDGMVNARLTTEGSDFDTLLYVRDACSQVANGADLAFSDDTQQVGSDMLATYSTIFLTGLVPGSVLFVVVDGKMGDSASNGHFRLTISPFTPGASGLPCATDAMGANTCLDAAERCSTANICTRVVATGSACDPNGLANTCAADASCVSDPSPPSDGAASPVCALPGTHAGAPCRSSGTRCDAPLVCNGQTDSPICVRVVGADQTCDPMGVSNQCATGLHCRTVAGTSFCEATM